MHTRPKTSWIFRAALLVAWIGGAASASADGKGFQINRYEPTAAGEWGFMVDHPWYSSTRWFAGGLTLNYAHDPLVYGTREGADGAFTKTGTVIQHQLLGHVDLAGSFLDRITLSASLPVTFLERGNTIEGISPLSGVAVGDPRFGVMARLYGHADRNPFSIHLGLFVWAPIKWKSTLGDDGVRVMPKLVMAGYGKHVLWSVTGAFYYRPESSIGTLPAGRGNSIGSELQIGAAIAYADLQRRFVIGPEAMLSTVVLGGDAFAKSYTSLELLLGATYNIVKQVQVGVAAGTGILREPGTPDARVLLRLAYAPIREEKQKPRAIGDRDGDGIPDDRDRCPLDPEDKDGFEDADGCPDPDNDKDGVLDAADKCPLVAGPAANDGCPDEDRDHDGIVDRLDKCPDDPEDKDGFEDADGCPDPDNDKDGVADAADKCPLEPGPAANDGCPDPDRDGDGVVDRLDNCPDEPGEIANQGCKKKQLVQLTADKLVIIEAVYFKTGKDIIEARSFPLLENVASVLKTHGDIRVLIEGHTDAQGKPEKNLDLSDRRAKSVMRFLVKAGVAASRLDAKGFGQTQPIADNKTAAGRAQNRRVVFKILPTETRP